MEIDAFFQAGQSAVGAVRLDLGAGGLPTPENDAPVVQAIAVDRGEP